MLQLYNTISRRQEPFTPLESKKVRFYHCGPTVYWTQHIGNLRGMTMADLLVRTLLYLGYEVVHVRNYTDVGHLTSDMDVGEDKMEKGAKREGKTPQEIADKYIRIFETDTAALNLLAPKYKPRATDYITEMKDMIQALVDKGYAYVTDLAVYFDVSRFEGYNKLSRQKMEELDAGAGKGDVQDPAKRHPADFALWFFKAGVHKNALQTWPSPWGKEGFPGWHIECSAMSRKLLGRTLDIHMGGVEHIPVHHTNEIAQSEAASGERFVNYWLHNEHLLVNGRKMAKSEGTGYSLSEVGEKGFDPMDLRYFFLQAHYRSRQNFTWEALSAAAAARDNLMRKAFVLKSLVLPVGSKGAIIGKYNSEFEEAISDDLNIPQALAVAWQLLDGKHKPQDILTTLYDFDRVLGLRIRESLERQIPAEVMELVDRRERLRSEKRFAEADNVRQQIEEKGYLVEDKDKGSVVKPKEF